MKALSLPVLLALPIAILAAALGGTSLLTAPSGPLPAEAEAAAAGNGTEVRPVFSAPVIIDCYRAGGEPVIAATASGALVVSAHPGYTHFRRQDVSAGGAATDLCDAIPGGAKLAASTQAQSYMWRSTDGGRTWAPVSLPHAAAPGLPNVPNAGPRGAAYGVSDPDFAIDANGRIWFAEIPFFAGAGPSVSWSDDDGRTWLTGRPQAVLGMDREWLAAHEDTVYLTGSSGAFYASRDGIVFERVGSRPVACPGDPLANPLTGVIYIICNSGLAVSADGGASWDVRELPVGPKSPAIPEVAIDAAGTVWSAGASAGAPLALARSADDGLTWTVEEIDVPALFPDLAGGTIKWVQTSAGSADRVAVTFLGAPPTAADERQEWRAYTLLHVEGALHAATLTPEPVHRGGMCTLTPCVWNQFGQLELSGDGFDRRMGEFFETTIDRDGFLHVVVSNTQADADDWVSHVAYVRLLDGVSLVAGELPPGFPTQG